VNVSESPHLYSPDESVKEASGVSFALDLQVDF
jgi:hypothetical protein